jgi:hypothetical protein
VETLYVDKTTRTFADNLIAFGLAALVDELLLRQGAENVDVVITDCGPYYELTLSPVLNIEAVRARSAPLCLARPIRTSKSSNTLPPDIPAEMIIDYEADREAVNQFYAAREKGAEEDSALPPYWEIERAINPLALTGYNRLIIDWWNLREYQPEALVLLLNLYIHTPNDYQAAIETWKEQDEMYGWGIKAEATCQQLYNPDQGKGQNKSKADGLNIYNVNGFWLAEWLKTAGFCEGALTRTVHSAKDRKTFVVAPRKLSLSTSRAVMREFLKSMTPETSTKFDILAVVRYTRALLEHFSEEKSPPAHWFGREPLQQRVLGGFDTAFYRNLGNATATMNISFIAIPRWVTVESRDDITLYIDPNHGLLLHLEKVARQFDESRSGALTLLQYLRDFVSGDDLSAFFRFTNAFAAYYMSEQEKGQYAYPLHTFFVERLVMSTEKRLGPILESEGFQNIAYAIRQSTITAQYRRRYGDRKYDVRYGLGQELARKARYPETFIAALSDFLHKFNAENARIMETRPGPYRRNVKTSDIDEIVWLIDQYGSESVANLLIAYGYAPVPREDAEIEAQTNEGEKG